MNKNRIKRFLDFIPFFILLTYAIILLGESGNFALRWQHFAGFIFLILTAILFIIKHQFGVLALGLTILLGLFGQLQFRHGISITTFGFKIDDDSIFPLFYGQPIFILWAILHFILSGRYYVGIVTKKYWLNLLLH